MIGVRITSAQVMTHEELASGEIIGASHNDSREWISLLAVICAILATIPSALIYQGELGDLRSTWVDDIGQDTVYFAAIPTRWSNNKIGR